MLGSLAFRVSSLSARRVQTPFTTPPVWPWRHQLCAHVFGAVSRAKGHDVGHQDDGPLHVSVTEGELSNIARTKECWLPGVRFDRRDRAWRSSWYEGRTYKLASRGVGKLEKKGMTENAASLAALRAAITLRNEKVVANVQHKVHFDDSELRAMAENKKCPIPGVSFHQGGNSWRVKWYEHTKQNQCYFSVKKFMAPDMMEDEASLAALRSAIDFRADKVGLHHHRRMKIIRIIAEGY